MRRTKMMVEKSGLKRRFVGRLLNKAYSRQRSIAWWSNFASKFGQEMSAESAQCNQQLHGYHLDAPSSQGQLAPCQVDLNK